MKQAKVTIEGEGAAELLTEIEGMFTKHHFIGSEFKNKECSENVVNCFVDWNYLNENGRP